MMIEIAEVMSRDEARLCRERLAGAGWRDGRLSAGEVAARVKSNDQLPDVDPVAADLTALVLERVGASPHFIAAALPLRIVPPRFNRYRGGGAYGPHIDNAVFAIPGQTEVVRSDLSATLFLSEPDEYDGGELVLGGERVKLPAGHLILYPSGAVHNVEPVTRGERLAAFFWVQSMVRDAQQRAMLFELDETIQTLRAAGSDDAPVTRLIGLYHNLLRAWADV